MDAKVDDARAKLDKVKPSPDSVEALTLATLNQERAKLHSDLEVERDELATARTRLSRADAEHRVAGKVVDGLATAIRGLDGLGKPPS